MREVPHALQKKQNLWHKLPPPSHTLPDKSPRCSPTLFSLVPIAQMRGSDSSQAKPRRLVFSGLCEDRLHLLFLLAASSLPGMIMFRSPMTPFVSLPDFLKTQYPLTTANTVHLNISPSAWCLGAGPPGLVFHSQFTWMPSCSSLSYMLKASHFSLIPPPLSKQQ